VTTPGAVVRVHVPITTDALALRHPINTQPDYSFRVPTAAEWLNSNDRRTWVRTHKPVRLWRQMAGWAAIQARVTPMTRAYVLAEFRFPDRRRRDPANWFPTVKACVDGLVDVGMLTDDSADNLIGPDLRLGPVSRIGKGALHLHVWRVE
jgi:crossover junction endodeoxyribonuclease RusA